MGRFLRPEDSEDDFVTFSPKLGLRHEISPDSTFFASLAAAARPPQISDLYRLQRHQMNNPAKAETSFALDIGLCKNWWGRGHVELAAYHMDKRNFFFRDADGFNENAGKTRHQGIEFNGNWYMTEGVKLTAAASYAQHQYRFDRVTQNQFETILAGNEMDTKKLICCILLQKRIGTKLDFALFWQKT